MPHEHADRVAESAHPAPSAVPASRLLLIVGIALAALIVAVWSVNARRPTGPTVEASLRDAGGLREGAPVHYRGVDVGRVQRIRLSDSAVHVTMRLTRDDVPLRADDVVRARRLGLLGDVALEIMPSPVSSGPWSQGIVLRGDTLAPMRFDSIVCAAQEELSRFLDTSRGSAGTAPVSAGGPPPADRP